MFSFLRVMLGGLPPLGTTVLVVAFLSIFFLVAAVAVALAERRIRDVVRDAGALAIAAIEAGLHIDAYAVVGLGRVSAGWWDAISRHRGDTDGTANRHLQMWTAIAGLVLTALLVVMVACEVPYAMRLAALLGLPEAAGMAVSPMLSTLLGILWIVTLGVIAAVAFDASGAGPGGSSLLFPCYGERTRRRLAWALGLCVLAGIVNSGLFAIWTIENLSNVNDTTLATVIAVILSMQITLAQLAATIPLFVTLGVLLALALGALRLLCLAVGMAAWAAAYIIGRAVQLIEAVVALLAGTGRLLWNPLAKRRGLPALEPAPRAPSIAGELIFPLHAAEAVGRATPANGRVAAGSVVEVAPLPQTGPVAGIASA